MSDLAAAYVDVRGLRLRYWRTGGEAPSVICAHGLTDNGLCWLRLAEELRGSYDVVMYDARGHGLSDAPADGYSVRDHSRDLVGLIEALDLGGAAVVGHSMGASTAALTAAERPDLVGRVLLEDPPWLAVPHTPIEARARAKGWRDGIVARRGRSRAELAAEYRSQTPEVHEIDETNWIDSKLQVSPAAAGVVEDLLLSWREIAPRIACPLLLVTGDVKKGALVPPAVAAEVREMLPQASTAKIAGATHSIRRTRFEPYLAAVRAFLARTD